MQSIKLNAIIAPSILSCDFAFLFDECQKLVKAGSDWLHIDIMDGHFVPNLTIGPPIVECLNNSLNQKGALKKVFLDCHCMVTDPEKWIEPLSKAGADQITVHYESNISDFSILSQNIRSKGIRAGLAIKPKSQIDEKIFNLLDRNLFDMILIMTVEPGFGGQKFMQDMMPKVQVLREKYQSLDIQVDGGIQNDNVDIVAKAGANVIVSGTGIVKQINQKEAIENMKSIVEDIIKKQTNI